jgi:enamine deaminase RidA (YjgF/YER057c/UK114 family)
MHRRIVLTAAFAAGFAVTISAYAQSDSVKRVGDPRSMISSVVWVGDTAYLSGTMAPAEYGPDVAKGTPAGYNSDTKAQAIGALKAIEKHLKAAGLGLGDIVQMTAFLAGDPAKGDRMDLDGWNEAYRMYFGTTEQPNKPVRATVQVAHLVLPTGRIEIMVIAARSHQVK